MQQIVPAAQLAAPLHLSAAPSPPCCSPASPCCCSPASDVFWPPGTEQSVPVTHIAPRPFWSMQQLCAGIEHIAVPHARVVVSPPGMVAPVLPPVPLALPEAPPTPPDWPPDPV